MRVALARRGIKNRDLDTAGVATSGIIGFLGALIATAATTTTKTNTIPITTPMIIPVLDDSSGKGGGVGVGLGCGAAVLGGRTSFAVVEGFDGIDVVGTGVVDTRADVDGVTGTVVVVLGVAVLDLAVLGVAVLDLAVLGGGCAVDDVTAFVVVVIGGGCAVDDVTAFVVVVIGGTKFVVVEGLGGIEEGIGVLVGNRVDNGCTVV
jgi:hypothetical protein